MLNHLLPQLVSSSSPPRPLLLSCFAFSLRSLLPSYTLFILTSVMFFPFTPVFLQILPFLSQETMNLPFLPHLVISSRHRLLIEQNTYRTAASRRFKKKIAFHILNSGVKPEQRTSTILPAVASFSESLNKTATQTATLRTSPPPNMADAVPDVVRRRVPWTSTHTSHSSPRRPRAHGNRQPNVERAAVNEV